MSLMALVLGLFFAVNIRRPMRMIQQGIAALTQGNLATRLHLGRRDEWRLIEEALNRLSTSLVQNAQLQAENLRMGAELDVTRKLQYMLLPTTEELRQIADLDIACYMEPADEVGGDYYDVLQHNGLIKIGIGDVTGHGLESGVLMVMTQTIVRALLANGETDPVRFLATLNRTLYGNVQRMGTDKNLTLALLDYKAGDVRLSGQHENMLVVRGDGTVEVVDTIDLGFPVALTDEITDFIQHTTVHLQPGDGVVLYTDGITEAENLAREQYGLARLCTMVSQQWGAPAEVIKKCVVTDVHQHMGAQKMYDDITLVMMKRR
jgi:serine phosphatase RsbU (regulator of sigma subunit)